MKPERPESNIRQSPAQLARQQFRDRFFAERRHPTSLGKAADAFTAAGPPPTKAMQKNGGKTINQAKGSGVLIFQDCEGTELLRIPGLEIDGEETIQTGCTGGSSYPG